VSRIPRRWVIVTALAVVTFGIGNPIAAFGVFLPVLSETFGWSRGAISIAHAINMLLGGVLGFGMGALADRYGPRFVLAATFTVAGAGFAAASTVTALWQLYLYIGVLVGLGGSSMYVVTTATVVRWFDTGRGLALGIVLTGFNLGFVTGGPLAAFLIGRVGWRGAYVILGTVVCAVAGLAALVVHDPPRSGAAVAHGTTAASNPGMSFTEALGSRAMWLVAVAWLVLGGVFMMLMVHIVPYARDRGLPLAAASLALTSYGVGAVSGRIVFGSIADRFRPLGAMRWCVAIQVLAVAALLLAPPAWLLAVLMLGFGFGFAGADTIVVKVIPDVFGVRALGAIMGVLAFGWRCGAALGPSLAGFVFDATGSYASPFAVGCVLLVVGFSLFAVAVRRPRPA
jgi:MFS family permease